MFFLNQTCKHKHKLTHLLGEVVVHLSGHGCSLVICYDVVLEEAHRLRGAAGVGFHGAQNSAVVLPVGGQLMEDQSLLICFSLQGIYPHCTGGQRQTQKTCEGQFKNKSKKDG